MSQTLTDQAKGCCTPSREVAPIAQARIRTDRAVAEAMRAATAAIPGGTALLGTDTPCLPQDGEGPLRSTKIKPFRISRTTITNAEFAAFVEATGYVTEAERIGWSFVFHNQVAPGTEVRGVVGAQWWLTVDGANWRNINGPDTDPALWMPDHPVVQVSWNDAKAYADWVGGRLPKEAEWEHAARGGQGDVRFVWGDEEPNDTDFFPCNIWQGDFPNTNSARDGFETTAPARFYEPNGYGLYNMLGNVWEWTSEPFRIASLKRETKARLKGMNPHFPSKALISLS